MRQGKSRWLIVFLRHGWSIAKVEALSECLGLRCCRLDVIITSVQSSSLMIIGVSSRWWFWRWIIFGVKKTLELRWRKGVQYGEKVLSS